MDIWLTLITVAGGILTGTVGMIAAAVKKLWDEVRDSHAKHINCEEKRLSDRIQHWAEMEEMRKCLGLQPKPIPTARDTQIAVAPLPKEAECSPG